MIEIPVCFKSLQGKASVHGGEFAIPAKKKPPILANGVLLTGGEGGGGGFGSGGLPRLSLQKDVCGEEGGGG